MTTKQDKMLLTMEQAASELSIGITKLKSLLSTGELHSIRIGRARRVMRSSLVEYTERLHVTQAGGTQ